MSILRRIFGGRIGKEKPTKQNIDTNRKDIYNILDIAPTVLSEKKELKLENCKFFIIEDNESTTNVLSFHLREAGIKAENISCAIDLPQC
jgi:hypothetical protein